jgi:hypothetical protein
MGATVINEYLAIPRDNAEALYVWIEDVGRAKRALRACPAITWIQLE